MWSNYFKVLKCCATAVSITATYLSFISYLDFSPQNYYLTQTDYPH